MRVVLVIWGAGGHGKVVLDIARASGGFDRIVFLDDDPRLAGQEFCGCLVAGGVEELQRFAGSSFVVAIGENRTRARCFQAAMESGLLAATLIHPSAAVSPSAKIGDGTVVMPRAVVNADAIVGEDCIINTGAVVEHDCRISPHVHVAPLVVLGGGAKIGQLALVGAGAVVLPGAVVGEGAVVGAGAVVLKEAPAWSTVVGVPARVLAREGAKD